MKIKILKQSGLMAMLFTAIFLAGTLQAHHSYALFDKTVTQTIAGTLYAVEWKNPHSWIWISVVNDAGEKELWGLEGGSPAALLELGYTKNNLVVGTPVTATLYPLKDGRTGGALVELKFADGTSTK